jgi:DNA-binding transcriptional ArsR family regulator
MCPRRLIYKHMNNYSYNEKGKSLNKAAAPNVLDERSAERLAEIFSALSDPSRIRIISALKENEVSVGALAEIVAMSESAVSHHLRGLRQLRLVRGRKVGRQVFYTLDDEHIADLFQRGLDHVMHS